MDIGSILLILSLSMITFLIISRPVLVHQSETTPLIRRQAARQEDHQRSALLAERDRLLNALQEFESDYLLGKFTEDQYRTQRAELMAAGVEILKKLDETAAGRGQTAAIPAAGAADAIEQLISERKRTRTEKSGGFCPKCGKPAVQSDKFCSRCGTSIH